MDADNAQQDAGREEMPQTTEGASDVASVDSVAVVASGGRVPWSELGKVHKPLNCPRHKQRYPLEGSTMCVHPDCLRRWLFASQKRNGFIRKRVAEVERLQIIDDFLQHMVLEFITQHRAGKCFAITSQWLAYSISNYLRVSRNLPRTRKDVLIPSVYDSAVNGERRTGRGPSVESAMSQHLNAVDEEMHHNPYKRLEVRELQRFMVENGAEHAMMLVRGDVNERDVWRIQIDNERQLQARAEKRARDAKRTLPRVYIQPVLKDVRLSAEIALRHVSAWAQTVSDEVYTKDGIMPEFPRESARIIYDND